MNKTELATLTAFPWESYYTRSLAQGRLKSLQPLPLVYKTTSSYLLLSTKTQPDQLRLSFYLFNNFYGIPGTDGSLLKDLSEDSLGWHDTLPNLGFNGTPGMAFLADLGDLLEGTPDP